MEEDVGHCPNMSRDRHLLQPYKKKKEKQLQKSHVKPGSVVRGDVKQDSKFVKVSTIPPTKPKIGRENLVSHIFPKSW